MTSAVGICNLALAHLGDEATVTSISPPEGSAQAERCARFYPVARRALIEMHDWGFATKRKMLVSLDNPTESWAYAYAMPANCLRVFAVTQEGAKDDAPSADFATETLQTGTKVIYTNVQNAIARYVVDVEDTTKFSGLFELALARLLASFLAGPIYKGKEGIGISQAMSKQFYAVELPDAKASDSSTQVSNAYRNYMPTGLAAMGIDSVEDADNIVR